MRRFIVIAGGLLFAVVALAQSNSPINAISALRPGNNLSDVVSASTSRTNLGLGTAAIVNTGTSGATIPLNNTDNVFSAGFNVQGIDSDGISTLRLSGSPAYTGTGTFAGLRDNSVYTMSGAGTPNADSILINSHITGAANLANYEGVMVNQTLDAGYTGTGTAVIGFENNLLTNNSGLIIPNYRGFLDDAKNAGNGCASGTCTSIEFSANGLTGSSGGGTLNNYDYYSVVPSGGAVTGTTNNRGIYITGNGGTNAGGTTNNFALYSDSTAQSTFAGIVRHGGISNLTFPVMGTAAGQQLWAIDATTINDSTDSGTIANVNINKIFAPALTSTNATTFTTTFTLDVEPPTCSGNLTCTNLSTARFGGNVTITGALSMVTTNINQVANVLANTTTSYELLNSTPTATVPDLITNRGDTTTGVGGASGHADLIAGGVNQVDCISTGCTVPLLLTLNAGITETGATASLNASSNFATNINTGTSTGIITLGNSGNTGKLVIPNLANSSAATQGTLCILATNVINQDDSLACLASLEELKDNHGFIDGDQALSELMQMKPFWFTWKHTTPEWKGDKKMQPGLGAHAIEKIDSRLAGYGGDGKLRGVRYQEMTAFLVAAIQAQQKEIAGLKSQIAELHHQKFH